MKVYAGKCLPARQKSNVRRSISIGFSTLRRTNRTRLVTLSACVSSHCSILGITSMSTVSSAVARRHLRADGRHRDSSPDPAGPDRRELQRSPSQWFDAVACLCQTRCDQMRWFTSSSRQRGLHDGQRTGSSGLHCLVLRCSETKRRHDRPADEQRSEADCHLQAQWDRHVSLQLREEQPSGTIESLAPSRSWSGSNRLRRANAVATGKKLNETIDDDSFLHLRPWAIILSNVWNIFWRMVKSMHSGRIVEVSHRCRWLNNAVLTVLFNFFLPTTRIVHRNNESPFFLALSVTPPAACLGFAIFLQCIDWSILCILSNFRERYRHSSCFACTLNLVLDREMFLIFSNTWIFPLRISTVGPRLRVQGARFHSKGHWGRRLVTHHE